jgi:hypothetical protein
MSLFCTQYLTSPPFSLAEGEADVERQCLTGYYGFLNYAVANWWRHVKRVGRDIDQTILDAIAVLSTTKDTPIGDRVADMRSMVQQLPRRRQGVGEAFPHGRPDKAHQGMH